MEIVLKDLKDRDKIEVCVSRHPSHFYESPPQGLVEDIVRWRDLEHPFLHTFLGARPVGLPRFFVYKHMRHGNVLEYLRHNHLAHRELLVSFFYKLKHVVIDVSIAPAGELRNGLSP